MKILIDIPEAFEVDYNENRFAEFFLRCLADIGIFDKERPLLKTTGCQRTGCVLCGFGCHLEKESRFLRLKETHPKFHNLLYVLKNNGVTYAEAIDWVNEHGNMNIKY